MSGKNVCSVDGCETRLRDEISFFRCPKDQKRCQTWKNALGFTGAHKYVDITPEQCHSRIRVCALHFDEDSFANSSRNRIHSYAVPSLRLPTYLTREGDDDTAFTANQAPNVEIHMKTNEARVPTDCAKFKESEQLLHKGNEIKKKWKNIKDCYLKHLRSLKDEPGLTGKRSYKNWQWAEHMKFCKPYLTTTMPIDSCKYENENNLIPESQVRTTRSPSPVREQLDDSNFESNELLNPIEIDGEGNKIKIEIDDIESVEQYSENSEYQNIYSVPKKRTTNWGSSSVDQIIEGLNAQRKHVSEPDAVDLIFQGYAKTVKSFSRIRQAVVKLRIAQVIMEEEIAEIGEVTNPSVTENINTSSSNFTFTNTANRRQSQISEENNELQS